MHIKTLGYSWKMGPITYYKSIKSPLLAPVSPAERVLRANNRLNANNKSRTVRPQYRTGMDDRRKENEKDRNNFSSTYADVYRAVSYTHLTLPTTPYV